jgi:nitrate/nitrite-specific signal transduction histidine kinase
MKQKIIISFILFILIIIINQILFQIDIKKQSYDAQVINKAGKQRMYCQQIAKIAMYANEAKNSSFYDFNIKTLNEVIADFTEANTFLENMNTTYYKNNTLDSLYAENNIYLKKILASSNKMLQNQDDEAIFNSFLIAVKSNEANFLKTMNTIVAEHQTIAEKKLHRLDKLQLYFNSISFLLLFYILFTIIIPLFKKPKIESRFK